MPTTKVRGSTQIIDESIFDLQIAPTAAIQLSKLQNGNLILLSNGSVAMTAPFNLGNNNIINVATPVNGTDAANKAYVDAAAQGLDVKNSSRAATVADIDLNLAPAAIDGVTLNNGDRILVKNQANNTENGIYVFNGAGNALTRSADANSGLNLNAGAYTYIEEGTSYAATSWVMTTTGTISLGTSPIVWTQFSGAGSYLAGNGLQLSGNTFSVIAADASIVVSGTGVRFRTVNSGDIVVGNASNIAAGVTMSGDATITNAGVITVAAQAIDVTKMVRAAAGQLLIGQGAGSDLAWQTVTGDVTISSGGVTTISAQAVGTTKLARQGSGTLLIGQGAGADVAFQAISGDISVAASGSVTLNVSTILTNHYIRYEIPSGAIDNTNVTFTLANTPLANTTSVFLNGVMQEVGAGNDYTISGSTVTFTSAPRGGGNPDKVWVQYWY